MTEIVPAGDTKKLYTGNTNLILQTRWCNIFGGENDGGAKAVLGGIGPQTPDKQWYCGTKAVGRYTMACEHAHHGQIMHLCNKHLQEFRTAVSFCPACNTNPPGHKCHLVMMEVS